MTDTDEIIRRIGDAEIVITNKTPISRDVFDACKTIRLVAVLATGYNIVDIAYAKQRGIPVCNVPAYGTDAVAQYAIAAGDLQPGGPSQRRRARRPLAEQR